MDDQKSLLSEQRGAHTKKIFRRGKVAAYMGNMLLRRIFFFFGKEREGLTRLSNKVLRNASGGKKKEFSILWWHFLLSDTDPAKKGKTSRGFFFLSSPIYLFLSALAIS